MLTYYSLQFITSSLFQKYKKRSKDVFFLCSCRSFELEGDKNNTEYKENNGIFTTDETLDKLLTKETRP